MGQPKRIFIVDDDEAALISLEKLLNLSGYQTTAVSNPLKAVSTIKSFKPHLILLDLLMPDLGGLEICDILSRDKETQGIPVIILSALGSYTDIRKAYQYGVVGYITKPYEFPLLLKEIQKVIALKE